MPVENKIFAEMTDAAKQAPSQKPSSGLGSKAAPDAQHPLEKRLARIEDITIRLHDLIHSPSLVRTEISAALDALKAELKAARESGRRPGPRPAVSEAPKKQPEKQNPASGDKIHTPAAVKINHASMGKVLIMQKPSPVPPSKPVASKQQPADEKTTVHNQPEKTPPPAESLKPKSEIHQKVADALAQINKIVNKQHDQY